MGLNPSNSSNLMVILVMDNPKWCCRRAVLLWYIWSLLTWWGRMECRNAVSALCWSIARGFETGECSVEVHNYWCTWVHLQGKYSFALAGMLCSIRMFYLTGIVNCNVSSMADGQHGRVPFCYIRRVCGRVYCDGEAWFNRSPWQLTGVGYSFCRSYSELDRRV